MSGVYIKCMEMPRACVYRENGHFITCPLYDIDGYCGALNREAIHDLEGRLCDCPLIPVPDHGDLIDRDALEVDLNIWQGDYADPAFSETAIDDAPVIIPADREADNG